MSEKGKEQILIDFTAWLDCRTARGAAHPSSQEVFDWVWTRAELHGVREGWEAKRLVRLWSDGTPEWNHENVNEYIKAKVKDE